MACDVDAGLSVQRSRGEEQGGTGIGKDFASNVGLFDCCGLPMGLDDRLTVHVAVLGPMELDASDQGHLGCGLGSIEVSGNLDQLAAVVCDPKADALHRYLIAGR